MHPSFTPAVAPVRPDKSRRRRTLLLGLITLVALTTSTLLVNLLADKFSRRFDVTATGQQQLSPRTKQLLASLSGPTRLVIATNLQAADPRALRNLNDVLDEMLAAQPLLERTLIDTTSPSGARDYARLLETLRERERPALDANVATITQSLDAGLRATSTLRENIAKSLESSAANAPASSQIELSLRAVLQQAASLCRVRADELNEAIARAREQVNSPASSDVAFIPATDQAAALLATRFRAAASDLSLLARDLRSKSQGSDTPGSFRDPLAIAAASLDRVREELSSRIESLATLPRPDILRLSRALSQSDGAVLIGPPAAVANAPSPLVALDLPQLLPARAWIDQGEVARRDLRGRAEEVLSTSLATLLSPDRPLIILVTPDPSPYLADAPFFRALEQRLSRRGIDMVEWQVAKTDAPDTALLTTLDPKASRPRVYVFLTPETLSDAGGQTGSQRAQKMGDVLSRLLEQGENVLVNLNPSIIPVAGGKDPIAVALLPLGIDASTGTPLMTQVSTPQGPLVETDRVAQATGSHVIATALGTLPTYVTWTIPMTTTNAALPILCVADADDTWGETEWTKARQMSRDQLAMAADRPRLNADRDRTHPANSAPDADGALWTIGAVSERISSGVPQRVVAIGSNTWFADLVTQQTVNVEGRPVQQFPGNLELFDACIAWLARQDATIAQSPTSRSVAMVRPMQASEVQRWRIGIIAGPALLVLALGGVYWLRRR